MRLADIKIGTRLYAGFAFILVLMMGVLFAVHSNFRQAGAANDINVHTYQVIGTVDNILESLVNIETGQRGFALTGQDASLEPLKAGKEAFATNLAKALSLTADNPAQQERLHKLGDAQRQWLATAIDPSIALRRSVDEGKEKIEKVGALEQEGRGKRDMDAMRGLIKQIDDAESALMEQRSKDAAALQAHTTMTIIIGGLLGSAFAVAIAFFLTRNITRPISEAVGLAKRVANGDLTSVIHSDAKDETGQLISALKAMNDALVGIVTKVRSGTEAITAGSAQIATGNLDLSSRTEEQASSLEETASSMEELTSTVKQNADNARQANELAVSASAVAVKGGSVVAQVVETMDSISASASKIADIIAVIDGIAFQTNILALNAAVEAARAGGQGRGFAVVASEVRTLAQRSAAAAKEIKTLIGDSVEKVGAGTKLVSAAGETMGEIVDSVKRVTDIMAEIAAASHEQSAGIEQVNQAIGQMDQVTQQNAALVEEAAAAAESLQDQAGSLLQTVAIFQVDARAAGSQASGAVVAPPRKPAAVQPHQSAAATGKIRSAQAPRIAGSTPAKSNVPAPRPVPQAPVTAAGGTWEEF
jgi:methyl-accepting chemotaxis protein